MAEIKTTLPEIGDALASLKHAADEKDKRMNTLFDEISKLTAPLEDMDMSTVKKYEVIMNSEYLLVRLRFLVNDEMKSIEYSLNMSEDITNILAIKSFFTKRKQYLISLQSRLNEIREDLNVLQRSYYNFKF